MSALSDTPEPSAATASPFTELPGAGPVVAWVDGVLNDFGWATAVNLTLELILLAGVGYALLRRLLAHAVPWTAHALVRPVNGVIDGLRVVCLLPDLAVARTARRTRRCPPALLYSYGNAVLDGADRLQAGVRKGLPALAVVRRRPGLLSCLALLLAFGYWNTSYCGDDTGRCESPAAQWVGATKTLLGDEDGAGRQRTDTGEEARQEGAGKD
ncbi:hypothetical protein ACFTXB_14455 [Streptomyces sp. NPDC057074]|uniref:hypothetical protein n=1 Tax=Streptomyces sp. NPDC057074 TaxID=3346015 RepID=UPI0036332A55